MSDRTPEEEAADYAEWDASYERPQRGWCDTYVAHDPHVYLAVNHEVYSCVGITELDLAELDAQANEPPCEHGLSADLCAGPQHYPLDDRNDY